MDVALIFPGQGAQTVGMGREFYEASDQAKAIFDQADVVIPGLKDVIFNGPQEKLTSTAFCQPAIFTFSMAAYETFIFHSKSEAVQPKFAAGLSLGELTAVCSTNALTFEEGLKLVERRSFFMDEACQQQKGSMAAVIGFERDKLVEICSETGAQVANFNSPDQIVITGEAAKVEAASAKITEAGAKRVIPLDVAGAFHSSLMQSAVPKFSAELDQLTFDEPEFGVVSNVDGLAAMTGDQIKENLAKQITSSVQWVDSVNTMAQAGVTTFLEIGPGTVLKGLIRKINKDLKVYNIQTPADIDSLQFEPATSQ